MHKKNANTWYHSIEFEEGNPNKRFINLLHKMSASLKLNLDNLYIVKKIITTSHNAQRRCKGASLHDENNLHIYFRYARLSKKIITTLPSKEFTYPEFFWLNSTRKFNKEQPRKTVLLNGSIYAKVKSIRWVIISSLWT